MERFNCQENNARPGNVIQTLKTYSQEDCAKHCCARGDCIGYDYNSITTDCYLTNKYGKAVSGKEGTWTCEKIPGTYFVFSVNSGIRAFSQEKFLGFREQSPVPEENGNSGVNFQSEIREFVVLHYWNTGNFNFPRKKLFEIGTNSWTSYFLFSRFQN